MRFRLYPTPEQEVLLLEQCAHARFVYNLGLEQRLMWRPERGPTPGFYAQCAQLTEARRAEPWLAAGIQIAQQQALRDLDQAWQNFFRRTHRRPTWRKQGVHESFRIVGKEATRLRQDNARWSSALVPKIGWVRFRRSRDLPEAWKSYRIVRDRSGRWHIALAVVPDPVPAPGTGEVVGLDRGVAVAAALSTGEVTSPAGLRSKESERLVRLERRLARATRGSSRRQGVKRQVARVKAREAARRKDWVEKTSTDLARRFDVIRVEDLDVARMTRSARGRGHRQKAGLNRGILKAGWTQLVDRLEHKAPGRVEKVKSAYTSQTCNECGHCARENRESQAVFLCKQCGHRNNADINAALNIAAGRAVTARGDMGDLALSVKREPQLASA